ncbi:CRAL/TRIO domain-containing protein [Pseudovirgaria hyperparasitica]|uniref:CRAL/TRIO domain-containing protein n=1 Tax=Pseudovirgaria hyperparasitica TaxID=470096 RepID=A0A6A6WFD3_9PEZI|nr:CRAL/TRIO domain-containing protein [Pseudovirgaria hyperparasitica]KAF2760869.1 CRAL/TRIO domain-containing protein [Pseudovirgaria hyperparasitica]
MADTSAPGRPGNLTPEQEIKLKEMWTLMHNLFGIHGDADSQATPAATTDATASSPAPTEKKKSRFSIWGRSKEPEPAPKPSTAGGVDLTSIEADDKYGLSKDFKETLATLSKEEIRDSFWKMTKHDHPDAVLLRFLRARKWDVNAALVMGVSTLKWRLKTYKLDDVLLAGGEPAEVVRSESSDPKEKKDGNDYIQQWEMGKSFIHGVDSEERPICYVRVRLHHGGEQGVDPLEKYIVHTIETARFMLRPPVDTATLVFDMTGFSLANMDYTPVKFMIKCFEANYPESLGLILIHNAPWVFQGVWKIIKGWMDPVVSSKVNFTSGVEGMSEFIPVDQIPKELGGDEDWEYKYVKPTANENEKLSDTATRDKIQAERKTISDKFEDATMRWIKGDEAAKAERTQLALELKKNYWDLDPYIRARTFYDAPRSCIINPGGIVDYYPSEKTAEAAAAPSATSDAVNGELAQKLDEKAVVTQTTPANGTVAT